MQNEIGLSMPGIPSADKLAQMPRGQRFDLLTPPELTLIMACADRACRLMAQWRVGFETDDVIEINPTVVQVDFAITHLCRRLDLHRLLHAPDLDFISDYTMIEKNIVRASHSMPDHVRLRFAQTGAIQT